MARAMCEPGSAFRRLLRGLAGGVVLLCVAFPQMAGARPVATVLAEADSGEEGRFLSDLAVLWERAFEPAPHALAVETMEPAPARLRALERGRADFAVVEASRAATLLGEHPEVVAVGLLWASQLHVLTRAAGPSALGLPLLAPVVVAPSARYVFDGLTEWSQDDPAQRRLFRMAPKGFSPVERAVQGGEVVVFSAPAPAEAVVKALGETRGLRLLPLANRLAEELQLLYPWLQTEPVPAGAYPGVRGGWQMPVRHHLMVARRDLPNAVAEKMVLMLYRRPDAVVPFNPLFATLNAKANAALAELVPFHPAVAQALRLAQGGS